MVGGGGFHVPSVSSTVLYRLAILPPLRAGVLDSWWGNEGGEDEPLGSNLRANVMSQ